MYTGYLENQIKKYLILMILAMFIGYLSGSKLSNIVIIWCLDLLGFFVLFRHFLLRSPAYILVYALMYILFCFSTILVNIEIFEFNLKSIGTNINILIVPLYAMLFFYLDKIRPFQKENIIKLFVFFSYCGSFIILSTWLLNYREIISTLIHGSRVYEAHVYGFMNGKNPYGIIVALSLCADLYLLEFKKRINTVLCVVKYLAVVLSFSRAALLQVTFAIGVFLFLNSKISRKNIFFILLACLSLAFIFSYCFFDNNLSDFIIQNVLRVDVGLAGRDRFIGSALNTMLGNIISFIFGFGYAGVDFYGIDLDNTYVFMLVSGGATKLLLFLILLAVSFNKMLKIQDKRLRNICIAVGVSYLLYSFFESASIFELGFMKFAFMLFLFFIPFGIKNEKANQSVGTVQ